MKILIIHSGNRVGNDSQKYTFVNDQASALKDLGNEVDYFSVVGKGVRGYVRNITKLRLKIREYEPDIIHAHYGLCGLLANIATRSVPVVTTFHGSDINLLRIRPFSRVAMILSAWNIFVGKRIMALAGMNEGRKCSLIPCGVTLTDNQLQTRERSRKAFGWGKADKKVLFAGAFDNAVKDPELAKRAIVDLRFRIANLELIELKGYTRDQVNELMCASNCLLMTSKTEGSPQVIKEAMACGCPIVSVDVGDVAERVAGIEGCYVVESREAGEIAAALEKAIAYKGKTNGRERIIEMGLSNAQVAETILNIYKSIVRKE